MKSRGKVIVAFSGGVDSALVAKIAYLALGKNALAVTIASEKTPKYELESAKKVAKEIGIEHLIVRYSVLKNINFVKNPPNRCYYCRKEVGRVLKKISLERGIQTIADGISISDFKEHRPGIKAADEDGIWHPLVECNFSKEDVRRAAKKLGLSIYNKPSMACLSSRIPYGEKITLEKLKRIEMAEHFLKKLGFTQVRVRNHKNMARIEVSEIDMDKFFDRKLTAKIVSKFKKVGFGYVTLDLEGYRSGSMDEVLNRSSAKRMQLSIAKK